MIQTTDAQTPMTSAFKRWPRIPLYISQRKVLLIGVDLFLLNACLVLGFVLSEDLSGSFPTIAHYSLWFGLPVGLWFTVAWITDSYDVRRAARLSSSVLGTIIALLITGAIYTPLVLLFPPLLSWRLPVLLVGLLAVVLLSLWRIAYATILIRPNFQRRALIVGAGRTGRTIAQAIKEHYTGYEIIGYVIDAMSRQTPDLNGVSILSEWDKIAAFARENGVSDLILAIHQELHADQLHALLKCFEQGVRIVPMPKLYEEITGRIPVEHIGERWLVSLPLDWDSGKRRLYLIVKRSLDLAISLSGILVLAPLFPLLAIAIKLDSPGPIFYRPERLGRGGKSFRLWKFRTMVSNADRLGDPTFTAKGDQRITRVGRILRALHIDELPQFFNVISGDMSIVGPRPERYVPELEQNIPYYRIRYAVKPGATGWALVNQGYAEGIEGTLIKLQYDLYYIKHQSLYLDILIIIKSVIHVLTMRGR